VSLPGCLTLCFTNCFVCCLQLSASAAVACCVLSLPLCPVCAGCNAWVCIWTVCVGLCFVNVCMCVCVPAFFLPPSPPAYMYASQPALCLFMHRHALSVLLTVACCRRRIHARGSPVLCLLSQPCCVTGFMDAPRCPATPTSPRPTHTNLGVATIRRLTVLSFALQVGPR